MQTILRSYVSAFSFLMSVADCERRNNRRKQLITRGHMNYDSVCARAYLEEWRSVSVRSAARSSMIINSLNDAGCIKAGATQPTKTNTERKKQPCAFEQFVESEKEEARISCKSVKVPWSYATRMGIGHLAIQDRLFHSAVAALHLRLGI